MTMERSAVADFKQALTARLRFYRDLGLTEFYRRPVDLSVGAAEFPELCGAEPDLTSSPETAPKRTLESGSPTPLSLHEFVQSPTQQGESAISIRKPFPAAPDPLPAVLPADRVAALASIRAEIGDCTRCALHLGRNRIVFADGSPQARLMFVGEGPGADEDAQGLPFVGKAGQLLNNMIAAMGLKREEVYIANVVKCRPPANRPPEPTEAHTCSPFLFQQIDVVRPEVLVALGATAATYLLGVKQPLAGLRGRIHPWRGTKLIITYHPAFLLRDPRQKKETWADLQIAMRELGLSLPGKN